MGGRGNSFAGRGSSTVGGAGNNNRNRNRGNRRPDTGYGAPRFKKSPLNNETASFLDLIDSHQSKTEDVEVIYGDFDSDSE